MDFIEDEESLTYIKRVEKELKDCNNEKNNAKFLKLISKYQNQLRIIDCSLLKQSFNRRRISSAHRIEEPFSLKIKFLDWEYNDSGYYEYKYKITDETFKIPKTWLFKDRYSNFLNLNQNLQDRYFSFWDKFKLICSNKSNSKLPDFPEKIIYGKDKLMERMKDLQYYFTNLISDDDYKIFRENGIISDFFYESFLKAEKLDKKLLTSTIVSSFVL